MESEKHNEWSSALDEDLIQDPVSAVIPPGPAPWSLSAGPWSSESSVPAVLHQSAEAHNYNRFIPSNETQSQTIQTEDWTEDRSTNTNENWESDMRALEDCSIEQYETLMKQHAVEQEEHNLNVHCLEKTRDDRNHQYQGFIEKIESLQVKLELNSSKTTRKNFMVKRQELSSEKEQMEDKKTRLAQELEDAEKKLKMLIEEQNQEKLSWEQEIADLRVEMETLCREAEQASQTVLQDEIAALEMQKELALSQVEDWIADAEKYLNFLRLNPSQNHLLQRQRWEQNVAIIRSNLVGLKNKFNENHQLLQRGEQLDSLRSVALPYLPPVPTLEMIMSPLQSPASHPVFNSGLPTTSTSPPIVHPQLHSSITPPQRATPPLSAPSPQTTPYLPITTGPQSAHVPNIYVPMTAHAPAPQITMQKISLPQTSSHAPVTPAPQILPQTHVGVPAASAGAFVVLPNNHRASFQPQAAVHLPQTFMPSTSARNSSPQPLPSNPAPAGKLDKLLERLGSHFPQCTRDQLTRVLQQIKSERGTMAGMSIDDLTQQVALRLAQNQKPVCNQKVLISLIHNVFLLFVSFCALPVSFLTLSLL
uniref:TTC3/DZIP3/RBM44-like helical domain-containing protein n=1 Tax=Cyprinus carpio TaxID=7962 RepID=A0A8C1ZAS0_CYPCA